MCQTHGVRLPRHRTLIRFCTRLGTLARSIGVAALSLLASAGVRAQEPERWAVCYGDCPNPSDLAVHDLVVLDADRHPPLDDLHARRRTVLAYISLTELGKGRDVFPELQAAGVLLDEHPVWADAHYVDFRRPEWTRTVLDVLIPRALASGFDGLFLDTLDDAEFLEGKDPARFGGMRAAVVSLVHDIRRRYPDIVLMANRGYAVVPQIAEVIDVLLGESVVTTFDAKTHAYARMSASDVEWQTTALMNARALNPRLRLFTLDYWDPADAAGVRDIYREERARGFVPYVSTPMLDRVVLEVR